MKLIDEKGRLFKIINVFDLIVLAAVLLAVALVGYKVIQNSKGKQTVVNETTYIMVVKCPGVPVKFMENLMKEPRIFYEANGGFVNAKIINAREENAVVYSPDADGKLVKGENPDLRDVYVDVQIRDQDGDNAVKIAAYAMVVGGKMTLKTPFAMCTENIILDIYKITE